MGDNIIYNEAVNEERKSARSFLLGGFVLSYQKRDGMNLYANISQNYRPINFNDMRVVNPGPGIIQSDGRSFFLTLQVKI